MMHFNFMKNDEKFVERRVAKIGIFATFLFCSIGGFIAGALYAGSSKAVRLLDDVHDIKQDYDKAKGEVAEDLKTVSNKAKESVENVDAKELGESTTKGLKEIGSAAKNRIIDRIKAKNGD